jgi:hypothetical protein
METLAALRTKGVEIRNTGLAITKSEQLADWVKLRDAWHAEAFAAVVKLNKHETQEAAVAERKTGVKHAEVITARVVQNARGWLRLAG